MMTRRTLTMLTVGALVSTSLTACGPDAKVETSTANVSHETARQAIDQNTASAGEQISTSLAFLEDSDLFNQGFDFAASASGSDTVCTPQPVDSNGDPLPGGSDCTTTDTSVEFDSDVTGLSDEAVDFFDNAIFVDANVESDSDKSVTYLLHGDVVCSYQVDGAPDPDCVQQVDDAEIRLYVTSPREGDIDVAVQVGPQKYNPLYFEFYANQLAVEVDLGGVKGAVEHLASVTGGDMPELPATMAGRVRAELRHNADDTMTGALSVLQAINVADGDYALSVAKKDPFWEITADPANKKLSASLDLGTVDALFPITSTTVDSNGNETSSSVDYDFHLGGASASTVLEAGADLLNITNVGLGDSTSTLDVDGEQVLAVDLNANDGRRYDATIEQTADGVRATVSPKLDLQVAMQFVNAADALGDVADWMMDDVLHVTLDGAAKPAVLFRDDGLEVVDGKLTVSLDKAGISREADAGMCVMGSSDVAASGSGTDTGTDPQPADSSNPVEDLTVDACP